MGPAPSRGHGGDRAGVAMTLVVLTLALVGPYALLTLLGRAAPGIDIPRRARAKVGLTLLLLITSSAHFAMPDAMARMLPSRVPLRVEIIQLTGVFEILAAIGIWLPPLAGAVGLGLVVMLLLFLPANVYAAFHHVPFGGHGMGPPYLLMRVPFQLLVMGWAWAGTRDHARRRHPVTGTVAGGGERVPARGGASKPSEPVRARLLPPPREGP